MAEPNRISSLPARASLRGRLAASDGMTLIETLVSALMVGLISLTLVGLDAAGKTTADQRRRSTAVTIAQADQERISGMSADQIAALNQTRTVTLDGTAYTVTSTGNFISSSAGSASCSATAGAADYAKVVSTVDWTANRRPDVVEQSIITPRAGGSLLAQAVNQDGTALPGVRMDVIGSDQNTDAIRRFGTTDAGGCTIFGALLVGDYAVDASLSGYVDADGNANPAATLTTTAGNTSSTRFTLGQPGRITASFTSTIGPTTYTSQRAPSLSWNNTGMATPGVFTPSSPASSIVTPMTLFPFITTGPGVHTNNYSVWAGRCTAAMPLPAVPNQKYATVSPANSPPGTATVTMPAMIVTVTYGGTPVRPDHIELTDSCGQNWQPSIRSGSTTPSTGWLGSGSTPLPGVPYGATYTVCADYDDDDDGDRKRTITTSNTNFTAGTSVAVPITSGSPSTSGTC